MIPQAAIDAALDECPLVSEDALRRILTAVADGEKDLPAEAFAAC